MTPTPMPDTRYILYARKSSEAEDRQVASVESQLTEMRGFAKKRGLVVVKTLVEARSAKNPGRTVFNQMLGDIYTGVADGIICWKLDRLARNPIDGGNIIWMLQNDQIHHIVTIEGDYNALDGNMLMLYMRFGMAGQYSLDLARDTKRGQANKVKMGWSPNTAPPGYLNERFANKGEKRILVDPELFPIVRAVFDFVLKEKRAGVEALSYARKIGLIGKHGRPISYGCLYRLLRNPYYKGLFRFSGNLHPGKHKPMITQTEFEAIQKILGEKVKRVPTFKHTIKYRGMISCGECGAGITAEHHTKTNQQGISRVFIYYRCSRHVNPKCSQKAIPERILSVQMERLLAKSAIIKQMQEGRLELRMTNGAVRPIKVNTSNRLHSWTRPDNWLNHFFSFRPNKTEAVNER